MFPKVTFQPQMPRGLGLSSQGLGVFEQEGFSYLQGSGHVASSPRMPALPICSLYKHRLYISWAPGSSADDEMETAAAFALPTIWQGRRLVIR